MLVPAQLSNLNNDPVWVGLLIITEPDELMSLLTYNLPDIPTPPDTVNAPVETLDDAVVEVIFTLSDTDSEPSNICCF